MKSHIAAFIATAILTALPASAQDDNHTPPAQQGGMMMQGGMMHGGMMQKGMMGGMQGRHVMTVTVTAIDAKTGLMDASAGDRALKLYFPPASLADVKAGDKLSVHMAFRKYHPAP